MEKNNEKELRIYSRPECEVVKIFDEIIVLQDIHPGSSEESTDF